VTYLKITLVLRIIFDFLFFQYAYAELNFTTELKYALSDEEQ